MFNFITLPIKKFLTKAKYRHLLYQFDLLNTNKIKVEPSKGTKDIKAQLEALQDARVRGILNHRLSVPTLCTIKSIWFIHKLTLKIQTNGKLYLFNYTDKISKQTASLLSNYCNLSHIVFSSLIDHNDFNYCVKMIKTIIKKPKEVNYLIELVYLDSLFLNSRVSESELKILVRNLRTLRNSKLSCRNHIANFCSKNNNSFSLFVDKL